MRLRFNLHLEIEGKPLGPQLLALLEALGRDGSLAAAARRVGCSYRHAWNLLRVAEREFGEPLAILERGRGAALSAVSEKLLAARTRALDETTESLGRIARDTMRSMATRIDRRLRRLRISASHDLALLELKQYCARATPPVALDLQFKGSLEALEDLARGRCEVAGFHAGPRPVIEEHLRRLLSHPQQRLVILADRRQGLMLAQGNPKAIHGLSDLTRRGVRFVNRQPASGTRLLLDRMLAEAKCRPSAVQGYETEEYTHLAVAATVASGHADAGLGIEAAAVGFGLDFIPLANETYYLAIRQSQLEREPVRLLLSHLASRTVRRRIARLPGYNISSSGIFAEIANALNGTISPPRPRSAPGVRTPSASRKSHLR